MCVFFLKYPMAGNGMISMDDTFLESSVGSGAVNVMDSKVPTVGCVSYSSLFLDWPSFDVWIEKKHMGRSQSFSSSLELNTPEDSFGTLSHLAFQQHARPKIASGWTQTPTYHFIENDLIIFHYVPLCWALSHTRSKYICIHKYNVNHCQSARSTFVLFCTLVQDVFSENTPQKRDITESSRTKHVSRTVGSTENQSPRRHFPKSPCETWVNWWCLKHVLPFW